MKHISIAALAVLACTAALAQAPDSGGNVPGGKAAEKAQMRVDARTSGGPSDTATMGINAMDANGDGIVTRREYNAYHNKMWKQMNPKRDRVSMADMQAMMKGGPN